MLDNTGTEYIVIYIYMDLYRNRIYCDIYMDLYRNRVYCDIYIYIL